MPLWMCAGIHKRIKCNASLYDTYIRNFSTNGSYPMSFHPNIIMRTQRYVSPVPVVCLCAVPLGKVIGSCLSWREPKVINTRKYIPEIKLQFKSKWLSAMLPCIVFLPFTVYSARRRDL